MQTVTHNHSTIVLIAFIALPLFACSDEHPAAPTQQGTLATQLIVSSPTPQVTPTSLAGAANQSSAASVFATSATVVYISLPPGSVTGGSSATIQNQRSGSLITVALINGGFDPVPIAAVVDDELKIEIHGAAGGPSLVTVRVPKRRPPTIVRSEPPHGKTDVPLNTQIEVVFSEPLDPTTVASGIQLTQAGQMVPGAAASKSFGLVAEYTPGSSLAPNTQYTVLVTTGIRDLAGDALEKSVHIDFTTATTAGNEQHDVTTVFCAPTAPALAPPTTAAFSSVGDMNQVHGEMATLLPDGRVIVFGGPLPSSTVGGGLPDTTIRPVAEAYDPAAKTFSPADVMITYRGGHPAVVLPEGQLKFLDGIVLQDGRVLFIGPNSAEIYDPVATTFMPTGPYAHTDPVRTWTTRTLLLDGRVLLTGYVGASTLDRYYGATELFDPRTGTFKVTGGMHGYSDLSGLGTLLVDGTVLIIQWSFDISGAVMEAYDPTTETFNTIGCLYANHEYSAAVRLRDGTVLIAGGQMPGGDGSRETVLYLPWAQTFVEGPKLNVGRHNHSATLLNDGTVLIAGGYSLWPDVTRTAEVLHFGQ